MEVQIISREDVKPSSPTPPHLRNLTLSFLDQKYGPLLVPTLLFYGAPKGGAAPLDITRLKTCLSQTLTNFYPLAGRYQTWGTVLCNDEGIPFVEAEVNCPLSSVVGSISSSSSIDLHFFYPPKENLISSGIHLAIQVSKFSCGGFAIGWYHTHKVTDGTSAATFLRHWSALVTKRYEDAAQTLPDFNAPVTAFPPVPEEVKVETPELNQEEKQEGDKPELNHNEKQDEEIPEKAEVVTPELNHKEKQEKEEIVSHPISEKVAVVTPDLNHKEKQVEKKTAFPPVPVKVEVVTPELNHKEKQEGDKKEEKKEKEGKWNFMFEKRIVVRSFVLNNKAVTELKAKSVSEQVPNPSRFVSVAGFLWKHIASASSKEGRTMLSVAVDLRSRSDPPLPKGAMGNILEIALARAEKQAELPELVAEIHGSISKMKDLVPEYQGENRVVAKERFWRNFINTVMEYKGKDVYVLTSWCKSSGFKDMDFGFGKPQWIVPVDDPLNHNQRNAIILTEYTDAEGDGFEAWLFLEEEPIKYLETCPEFLAFSSPNF